RWVLANLEVSSTGRNRVVTGRLLGSLLALLVISASAARGDLALDLRADDPTHINVVGGKGTSWTNEAAPGQVFTSDDGQSPDYVANAINGLPAVRFNGATENDVLASIGFGESASNLTVFIVAAPSSNPGGFRGFLSAVNSSTPGHQDYRSGIN